MELIYPHLHPGQQEVWNERARFKVLASGRRWGKTMLGSLACIDTAKRGGRAWWVAPSYKMAQVGWRAIYRLCNQIPGAEIRRGDLMVIMPGGGSAQVRSADDPQSLRGEGLTLAVMDECAFMLEETWTEVLRPALSDKLGSALFISTPKRRNWFWQLYQRGQDGTERDWCSWRFPTAMNPYISPAEIAAAKQELPERIFEQEYLAEFLEGEGAVFRNIPACLHAPKDTTPAAHAGHRIVMGVDWAQTVDFTVLSVLCATCHQELALDRFNQIDYIFQRGRLQALADKWHVQDIIAEANSIGTPVIEELHRSGLPVTAFQTTATSKPPLIESLALAFERTECQWLHVPVATGELEAYERKVSAQTGRSSYSAPEGVHDDTVIARALAWHGAINQRKVMIGFV